MIIVTSGVDPQLFKGKVQEHEHIVLFRKYNYGNYAVKHGR